MKTFRWENPILDADIDYVGGSEAEGENYEYSIMFFNEDGEEILFLWRLTGTSYNLTQDEWERIIADCDSKFTISVISNQIEEPETDWYFSAPVTFDLP